MSGGGACTHVPPLATSLTRAIPEGIRDVTTTRPPTFTFTLPLDARTAVWFKVMRVKLLSRLQQLIRGVAVRSDSDVGGRDDVGLD